MTDTANADLDALFDGLFDVVEETSDYEVMLIQQSIY